MKTYISGKITGLEIPVAEKLFEHAELQVKQLHGGEPVNPMKILPYHPEHTYKDYMIADIKALFDCEAIYMLSNWRESRGARIEHTIAIEMGHKVFYQ